MPTLDYPVPTIVIERFLRYVRTDTDIIAVKIANEALDRGESIDQILSHECGMDISVNANRDGGYDFHVSCIVGSGNEVVGDGGNWRVDVDTDGNIIHAAAKGKVFYD